MFNQRPAVDPLDFSDKSRMRAQMRAWRGALSTAARAEMSRAICAQLSEWVRGEGNAVLGAFIPVQGEPDIMPFVEAWPGLIALPRATPGAPLIFHHWKRGDALERNAFGVPEPSRAAPALSPDILLVPLLAFDAYGHRLGYGGGYYDRTLATLGTQTGKKPRSLGIAYSGQRVAAVPREGHDAALNAVVTEAEILTFLVD